MSHQYKQQGTSQQQDEEQPLLLEPTNETNDISSDLTPLQKFADQYQRLLGKYPILTKAITSSIVSALGNFVCQFGLEKKPLMQVDWKRLAKYTAVGFLLSPISHTWFKLMDKFMKFLKKQSEQNVGPEQSQSKGNEKKESFARLIIERAIQVFLDQTIFSPIINICFFSLINIMDGVQGAKRIPNVLKTTLWPTLKNSWKVWPFAAVINYSFIPPDFRVLFSNFVSFFWSIYLSMITN